MHARMSACTHVCMHVHDVIKQVFKVWTTEWIQGHHGKFSETLSGDKQNPFLLFTLWECHKETSITHNPTLRGRCSLQFGIYVSVSFCYLGGSLGSFWKVLPSLASDLQWASCLRLQSARITDVSHCTLVTADCMFVFGREREPDLLTLSLSLHVTLFRSLWEGWKAQALSSMKAASEGISTPALPLVTSTIWTNSSGTHGSGFPFFKANFTTATVSALKGGTATFSHFRYNVTF